jgi:three-Cys-motif partner protein
LSDAEQPFSCVLSDGLPCRASGEWARGKLQFIDQYGPPSLDATLGARRPKREAVLVDLYAATGVCADDRGRFLGSALRAVTLRSKKGFAFTGAHFVNLEPEQFGALQARLNALDKAGELATPRASIIQHRGDANKVVFEILDEINPSAYVFAVLDPEKPNQLEWRTVQALRQHRGHKSVDLYMLFPTAAFIRMLCYKNELIENNAGAMDRFFGDESWRRSLVLRRTKEQRIQFMSALLESYMDRLRIHWKHVHVIGPANRRGRQRLYHMIFASDHSAGRDISTWAKRALDRAKQLRLFD